ncbi:haloacid dehalogenase type II [Lichenibacterium ramalinae]|uniref:Haloacid dehalogenase type II n=1 Tax=Lichenibacterium ramalinae TaxID=2316527 RepID=A0A4Q2RAD6_9HYPH|nr:haloacid dehalogenase type II [Lichenibacterium ramalinae]RYB02562.1 haloacid dehalogenase type II [Lichenibacterium ramalinae]
MTSATFRPKYISFDCYGTLTRFHMGEMAESLCGDRIPAERMPRFVADFSAYRLDEILGVWKPYAEVIGNALRRTCALHGVPYREADGAAIYEAVPTWGPHPDVPAGLSRVAGKIPLVILSNAMTDQIPSNVEKLGAPFHRVYTAQQAQAYKPRFQAFEYMFDQLGARPEEMMHVSSSFRYDQMSAFDLHFGARVWVGRGHEPRNPHYFTHEIADIGGLAACCGL